jgi:type IV pilus assembly protein PilB
VYFKIQAPHLNGRKASMGIPAANDSSSSTQILSKKYLGEVLVELGFVTQAQVDEAIQQGVVKRMRMGELLLSEQKISEEQLAKALAIQYGLEFVELTDTQLDPNAVKTVPEKVIRNSLILPYKIVGGSLVFAVYDPIQFVKFESFRKTLNMPSIVQVTTKTQLLTAFDRAFADSQSVEKLVAHLAKKQGIQNKIATTGLMAPIADKTNKEPSVEGLCNKVIDHAIADRASDIHVDPSEGRVRVRYRIDGMLHDIHTYPLEVHPTIVSRLKVLAGLDISEKRAAQDGRFLHSNGEKSVDIRISTLPTIRGEKIVLRLLDHEKVKQSFSGIGMATEVAAEVNRLIYKPYGLILVTGPTGSGKSTTLYTLLNQIRNEDKNIITVEDPVEFRFDGVNQVQVNEKAGVSFASVLRNILRQDPDVIMVGEIRDRETADIAVRAALTGHLVISTLHTNDSVSTPTRLLDMGIEPFLLSAALLAVISQRLVRVVCSECRGRTQITESDLSLLGSKALAVGSAIYKPVGCEKCHFSGYRNRLALFELMSVDETIQRLIVERRPQGEITAYLHQNGFINLRQDGIVKIAAGLTTVDEILRATF